jgi:hypothetical protein
MNLSSVFRPFNTNSELSEYLSTTGLPKIQEIQKHYILRYSSNDLENAILILNHFTKDVNPDIHNLLTQLLLASDPLLYNLNFRLNSLYKKNNNNNKKKSILFWLNKFKEDVNEKDGRIMIKTNNGNRNVFKNLLRDILNEIIVKLNKLNNLTLKLKKPEYSQKDIDNLIIYRGVLDSILIYLLHLFTNDKFKIDVLSKQNKSHNNLMLDLIVNITMHRTPLKKENLPPINDFYNYMISSENSMNGSGKKTYNKK